jgi:type IV pilus assembly protein PilO
MALPAFFDPLVNLPKQGKLGLGFGGLIALAGAVWYLAISPVEMRIATLESEHKNLQNQIAQSRTVLASLEAFRQQSADLEKKLQLLTEKLPSEREMPPLYRTLSDAAYQSGLAVSLFQPRDARIRDYYSEIPITITAEGGYHQLAQFIDRVAGLPRVVVVGEWKLSGLNRSRNPLRADLTLATYTYRPVGSPPAPKQPGARS